MSEPDNLNALHDAIAKLLNELITKGRPLVDKGQLTGEYAPATAADLAQARHFLKDCGFQKGILGSENTPVGQLIRQMQEKGMKFHDGIPDMPDEDVA